jgi:hypothetical protein
MSKPHNCDLKLGNVEHLLPPSPHACLRAHLEDLLFIRALGPLFFHA